VVLSVSTRSKPLTWEERQPPQATCPKVQAAGHLNISVIKQSLLSRRTVHLIVRVMVHSSFPAMNLYV
jgi:hypothetical protein